MKVFTEEGIGAKTAVGYGRFDKVREAKDKAADETEQKKGINDA